MQQQAGPITGGGSLLRTGLTCVPTRGRTILPHPSESSVRRGSENAKRVSHSFPQLNVTSGHGQSPVASCRTMPLLQRTRSARRRGGRKSTADLRGQNRRKLKRESRNTHPAKIGPDEEPGASRGYDKRKVKPERAETQPTKTRVLAYETGARCHGSELTGIRDDDEVLAGRL